MENILKQSHKRYNILTGEWVLVSPHRNKRPWQGQTEKQHEEKRLKYDEKCYLCPSNVRANGEENPNYTETYVFQNDFAALQKLEEQKTYNKNLLKAQNEYGICRVICFSPDHSKTMASLSVNEIQSVIKTWQREYAELGAKKEINYVQIFENKGAVMGCSNPHPHGQIWAQQSLPNEIVKKSAKQKEYYQTNKTSLLSDYIKQEIEEKERIIYQNDDYVVLVPYWAVWPFETMIMPKKHQQHIGQLSENQTKNFADALKKITTTYDKLFNTSFPYSSGIHQSPTNSEKNEEWHWHMSFYPPLLRSATIKKFMVGYEMFAMPQRDLTAETAAKTLREI